MRPLLGWIRVRCSSGWAAMWGGRGQQGLEIIPPEHAGSMLIAKHPSSPPIVAMLTLEFFFFFLKEDNLIELTRGWHDGSGCEHILPALAEDRSSTPSTHVGQLTTAWSSSSLTSPSLACYRALCCPQAALWTWLPKSATRVRMPQSI